MALLSDIIKKMKLKPYSYLEVTLEAADRDSALRARLADYFSGFGIKLSSLVYFEPDNGGQKVAAYLRSADIFPKIRARFKKAFPKGVRLKKRLLVREDWFDKWQNEYQIMPLGKKFTLVPLWQRKKYQVLNCHREEAKGRRGDLAFKSKIASPQKNGARNDGFSVRVPILMDPKGAFGSGTHPTTQIMAELMERLGGRFKSFLDLGCGTGILSILAAKLGAEAIWAVDNDAGSVKAAKYNFKVNQIKAQKVWRGDIRKIASREKFDLVGANMISTLLLEAKKVFFGHVRKGGWLIVSGIHLENLKDVRRNFKHPSFRCLAVIKKRGWAGLIFKKK